jgi:hypothetical protein
MAREKFTIRLSDEEKDHYRKHVEDHTEFDSLSRWFRDLADTATDSSPDEDTSGLNEALLNKILTETIEPLRSDINALSEQLGELDEAVRTGDDITELAEEAYLLLSGHEPEHINQYPRESAEDIPDDMSPEWYARQSGSPEAFAVYFGIDVEVARRVLVRCENMFPSIESELSDTGKRYWFHKDARSRNYGGDK